MFSPPGTAAAKTDPITGRQVPDETQRVPLLAYTNSRPAERPAADFVIGNLPFLGTVQIPRGRRLRPWAMAVGTWDRTQPIPPNRHCRLVKPGGGCRPPGAAIWAAN